MDNVDSPPNERKAISSVDGTLLNSTVSSLSWSNISVLVKDKATGHDKHILTDLTGSCRSGQSFQRKREGEDRPTDES